MEHAGGTRTHDLTLLLRKIGRRCSSVGMRAVPRIGKGRGFESHRRVPFFLMVYERPLRAFCYYNSNLKTLSTLLYLILIKFSLYVNFLFIAIVQKKLFLK